MLTSIALSSRTIPRRTFVILAAFLLAPHVVVAQQAPSAGEYTPKVGQPGKDIVWVPTPEGVVEQMLQLASVGPEDYVIDLGSGDGRTVIMAAEKFGARGLGIEYNPDLVALSKRKAELAGVGDKVEFVEADFFETDIRPGTVITMYLSTILNLKLRPKLLALRPGTRIVSHAFAMPNWKPDKEIALDSRSAYLWIVPAKAAGKWKLTIEEGEENWALAVDQQFQMLSGRVDLPSGSFDLLDGRMEGLEIRFHFIDARGDRRDAFGRVFRDRLEGTVRNQDGTSLRWSGVPEGG